MTFPLAPIDLRWELFYDNFWHPIANHLTRTSNAAAGGLTITRGASDEQSAIAASLAQFSWSNHLGIFSSRNVGSPLYGKIGRNTEARAYVLAADDNFDRTVPAGGFGTSSFGYPWAIGDGDPNNFSVSGGTGKISLSTVNDPQVAYLDGLERTNTVVSLTVSSGAVATGSSGGIFGDAGWDVAILARFQDTGNFVYGAVVFDTDGTCRLLLLEAIDGASPVFVFDDAFPYDASTVVGAELVCSDGFLSIRAWDVAKPMTHFGFLRLSVTVGGNSVPTLTRSGHVGVRVRRGVNNLNASPVVLSIDDFLVRDVRFSGEVAQWPQRWDPSGSDVWVPLEAAGILRRLEAGSRPAYSALRQFILGDSVYSITTPRILSYWPLEDPSESTHAASAITGVQPLAAIGTFDFAAGEGPPGSDNLPSIADGASLGYLQGTPTPMTIMQGELGYSWHYVFWFKGSGTSAAISPIRVLVTGDTARWIVTVTDTGITLTVQDDTGAGVMSATIPNNYLDDEWHICVVFAFQNSSTTTQGTIHVDNSSTIAFDTTTGILGYPVTVRIPFTTSPTNIDSFQIGHLFFATSEGVIPNFDPLTDAANGHNGELAGVRIARLTAEYGIALAMRGEPDNTPPCGPQTVKTLVELLQEAAEVDLGVLGEAREMLGLSYRTRTDLYNQDPALTLTGGLSDASLEPPVEPIEDDQNVTNDVTVNRPNGSGERYVLTSGPLSVNPPPKGIGSYDSVVEVNTFDDPEQLLNQASWRVRLGTIDEARWPSVLVDLADPRIIAAAMSLNITELIAIGDLPTPWMPDEVVSQILRGYTEVIDPFDWTMKMVCVPASPYVIGTFSEIATGSAGHGSEESVTNEYGWEEGGATGDTIIVQGDVIDVSGAQYADDKVHGIFGAAIGDNTEYVRVQRSSLVDRTHSGSAYVNVQTLGASGAARLITFADSTNTAIASIRVLSTGEIDLANGAGTQQDVSTTTITTTDWLRLDWQFDQTVQATPTLTVRLFIARPQSSVVEDVDETLTFTAASVGTDFDRWELGALSAIAGYSAVHDTLRVANELTWLGPRITSSSRYDTDGSLVTAGVVLDGTSGSYASTADDPSLDVPTSGILDVRVDATLNTWFPTAEVTLVAKSASGGQRSFEFMVNAGGGLIFRWFTDGSTPTEEASVPFTPPSSGRLAVRCELDTDAVGNHQVLFFTAPNINGPWELIGQEINAGTTSVFSGTSPLEVGSHDGGTSDLLIGVVHAVAVRAGPNDVPPDANPDFSAQASGTTTFADSAGKTWNVNGTAFIAGRPVIGTSTSIFVINQKSGNEWSTEIGSWPFDVAADVRGGRSGAHLRVVSAEDPGTFNQVQELQIERLPRNNYLTPNTLYEGTSIKLVDAATIGGL